jgi:hypothetical protein
MTTKPPYLAAAFFCDQVLQEQDGVASAIRIIDRIFIPELAPPKDAKAAADMRMFISFKGGGYVGKATVKLAPTAPSGKALKEQQIEIQFSRELNAGANIIIRAALAFEEEGVYWFDVYCNDELVTRMPLDVQLMTPEMLRSLPGAAAPRAPEQPK